MKVLSLSFLLLWVAVFQLSAQTAKISPSTFNATDRITITFDLTGSVIEKSKPIYLWAWAPGVGDCPTNGQWSASGEANILTQPDSSKPIWTISFVPSKFYGFDAGKFTQIGCLAKAKDGTGDKKTKDFVFDVSPVTYTPSIIRTFPSKFAADDVMTFVYDQSLDTAAASVTKALTDPYVFVEYALLGENNFKALHSFADDFTQYPELKLKAGAKSGTFMVSTILNKLITLTAGQKIEKLRLKLRSADGTLTYPVGPGASLNKILLQ